MADYAGGYPAGNAPVGASAATIYQVFTGPTTPLTTLNATPQNVSVLKTDGVSNWIEFDGTATYDATAAQPVTFYLCSTTAGAENTTSTLNQSTGSAIVSIKNFKFTPAASTGQVFAIKLTGYFPTPPPSGTVLYLCAVCGATPTTLSNGTWGGGGLIAAGGGGCSIASALVTGKIGPSVVLVRV